MITRSERKAAADARRLEWRTRWSKIAREEFVRVKNIDQAVRIVSVDMQRMADATPQLKSEIIRAGNEFLTKLAAAVVVAAQAS